MKSASSAFLTELYKLAGKKSLWLAKIYYDSSNYFLCSTDRVQVDSDIYNPWVQRFGAIRMGVYEDNFLAPPNEVEINLFRNSTTENLLGSYAKGKKVLLWQWFSGLTSFSTNALTLGTFIINEVTDIGYKNFVIRCLSDESKVTKEIPENLLNKTDYPDMLPENEGLPFPMLLGDLRNPTGNDYRYFDSIKAAPGVAFCVDKFAYKFLSYRHPSIGIPAGLGVRAYEYRSDIRGGMYATIEYPDGTPKWDEITGSYWRQADLKPYTMADKGHARAIRLLADYADVDCGVSDWRNAVDLDRSTKAHFEAGSENYLKLRFSKIEGLGSYLPVNDTSNPWNVKVAFNIDTISGTLKLELFYVDMQYPVFTENFTTTGYHISSASYGESDPLDLSKMKIAITLTSGTLAAVDGVHIWLTFWSQGDTTEIERSNRRAPRRRTGESDLVKRTIPEIKLSKIFVEGVGPQDQSGQGWNYRHALSILFFILNKICGIPSNEIAVGSGSNWNTIYGQMGANWLFAKSIYEKMDAHRLIESLLHDAQLKMWRDSNNQFRLFRINVTTGPNWVFSDEKPGVYLLKNFRWGYTDTFYNKFELTYRFSPGKNDFQETYIKDRNNDSDLQTSYANYGNTEVSFSDPEFEWVRELSVMNLVYPILKKFWKQLKIWIEFDTSLVGCLLELGDTIRVDHPAQTWAKDSKDFQVMEIEQDNNQVHIKAIEVIP